jgi:type IX secretion system PorP/SprF family membrane protein
MINRQIYIILIFLLYSFGSVAQDTNLGPGYNRGMVTNPSFSGTSGDGHLRLLYFNFYPGQGYNLNSFFLLYDTYLPVLHGGTGIYISNDIMAGIINDLRTGFGYAYHLKADKDFYINAGITASLINRSINAGRIILPDQIDPLGGNILQSGETITDMNHTVFDIGVGFLFTLKNLSGGFSLNHFAEPDISGTGIAGERLKRKYSFQFSGEFINSANGDLSILPAISAEFQGNRYWGSVGSSVRYKVISINIVMTADNVKKIDLQTGFSVLAGKAVLFYNYKFNIISQSGQFPFSLLHMAGVSISLNNVDKRKIIKTINFPEL